MNDLPDTPRFRFGLRFSLLARRWRQVIDRHLSAAGLSDATWVPLVHLQETGGGLTQKDLAARMGIDTSSLVRLLDILCRQSLVERKVDEQDARARLIYLTPLGAERVTEIRRELYRAEEDLLVDLTDEDVEDILNSFEKIDARLREAQARQHKEAT